MRVAITGATGLLGRALLDAIKEGKPSWEVTALSRNKPAALNVSWISLDAAILDQARETLTKINPDAVIHLAAMRSPDECENNPDAAFENNYLGARNVALACDRFDTELLYVSTDQVFYGADPDIVHYENERPIPANVYGRSKLQAEDYVRSHLRRYWIVRTGKLFGGPNDTFSFIQHAFTFMAQGKSLRCAVDWAAHTTHANFVSRAIAALLERKTYGVYHLVSPGVPNYLEIASYLAEQMGAPKSLAVPSSRKEIGLGASRPPRMELSDELWRRDFGKSLPDWREGIRVFLKEQGGLKKIRESP